MADRLQIDKRVFETIIPKIDKSRILRLDLPTSKTERIDLFLFAAAVGIHKGYRTSLSAKHGFIQNSAIPAEKYSLIFSLLTDEMRANNTEEKISDLDEAQTVVQEYANTGFYEIEQWVDAMNGQYDDERAEGILWDKLFELDEMYDSLFGDGEGE